MAICGLRQWLEVVSLRGGVLRARNGVRVIGEKVAVAVQRQHRGLERTLDDLGQFLLVGCGGVLVGLANEKALLLLVEFLVCQNP